MTLSITTGTATEQNLLQVAADLLEAQKAIKSWQEHEAILKSQLLAAHADGLVASEFLAAGSKFKVCEGRKTFSFNKEGAEEHKRLIEDIKAEAVAAGVAGYSIGSPYLRITVQK